MGDVLLSVVLPDQAQDASGDLPQRRNMVHCPPAVPESARDLPRTQGHGAARAPDPALHVQPHAVLPDLGGVGPGLPGRSGSCHGHGRPAMAGAGRRCFTALGAWPCGLRRERTQARVGQGLGQPLVANHPANMERLDPHSAGGLRNRESGPAAGGLSLPTHTAMPAGALIAEGLPTVGVLIFAVRVATAGDGLVAASQLAFGLFQGPRVGKPATVRSERRRLEASVHPYRRTLAGRYGMGRVEGAHDRHKPASRVPPDMHLQRAAAVVVRPRLGPDHPSHFGQADVAPVHADAFRVAFAGFVRFVGPALVKRRKPHRRPLAAAALEVAVECVLEVAPAVVKRVLRQLQCPCRTRPAQRLGQRRNGRPPFAFGQVAQGRLQGGPVIVERPSLTANVLGPAPGLGRCGAQRGFEHLGPGVLHGSRLGWRATAASHASGTRRCLWERDPYHRAGNTVMIAHASCAHSASHDGGSPR